MYSYALVYLLFSYLAFCNPAEAFFVNLKLNEISPQDGQTCVTLDNNIGIYQLIPSTLLSPGLAIPANCTIKRLVSYSCEERSLSAAITGGTKRTKSKRNADSNGAKVQLSTIVLCNACQQAGSPQQGSVSNNGKIVDQDSLQPTLGVGNIQFSVTASEKSRRERSKRTATRRTRKGFFYCNNQVIRSLTSGMQCSK